MTRSLLKGRSVLVAGFVVFAAQSHASSVLLNFGDTTAAGWNNLSFSTGQISGSGLTDTLGAGSYSVATTGVGNFFNNSGSAQVVSNITWATGIYDGVAGTAINEMESTLGLAQGSVTSAVYQNGVYNGGFSGSVMTVGGLTAGQHYTFYYIAGDARTDSVRGGITVNAGFYNGDSTFSFDRTSLPLGDYSTGTNVITAQTGYLTIAKMENLVANQNGQIAFTLSGGRSGLNALAFTAIPEPSTYGLMGAGALAAVALVRRRRRA